jgi:hypothetical protein
VESLCSVVSANRVDASGWVGGGGGGSAALTGVKCLNSSQNRSFIVTVKEVVV